MSDELSSRARALLGRAMAEERGLAPGAARRHELKRGLLQAAAASGVTSATLAKAAALEGSRVLASSTASAPLFTVAKGIVVGMLVSSGILGGVQLASSLVQPATHPNVAPSSRPRAPDVLDSAAPRLAEPAMPEPQPEPVVSPPAPALKTVPTSAPVATDPALRGELALMTAAQAALRDGKPGQALQLLERYEVSFPQGQLSRERLAVEVFAACQLGDRARAARAADRFLQRDSDSALAERVKQACPGNDSGAAP